MSTNKLLWEKWRPKKMEDIILLPRIRNTFKSGVNRNFIFYGHFGTGKTTLARILIKGSAYLEINSSLYTSIDVLRNKIDEFCSNVPMFGSTDGMKYVFLDEFERVSPQYQDALKGFIEHYSRNVRFILITNHLNKVSEGIISRCSLINFDCQNAEEEKYLKKEMFSRILNTIIPEESITISKEDLAQIINSKFPDFRSVLVELHNILDSGEITKSTSNSNNIKLKNSLYRHVLDKAIPYDQVYHFLVDSFGPEKIDDMLRLLGRPFIDYCLEEKKTDINNLFIINNILTDKAYLLDSKTIDPIVLGMSVIGRIRELLI